MLYERINKAIKDSGLKQNFIAERLDISDSALSAMLSGKRNISADEFFTMCEILQKTPGQLYNYGKENN